MAALRTLRVPIRYIWLRVDVRWVASKHRSPLVECGCEDNSVVCEGCVNELQGHGILADGGQCNLPVPLQRIVRAHQSGAVERHGRRDELLIRFGSLPSIPNWYQNLERTMCGHIHDPDQRHIAPGYWRKPAFFKSVSC